MISVGAKNKHLLIQLLKKKLDKYIESIPDKMIHNFSNKDPDLVVELKINCSEFEVLALREENEKLRKQLERAKTHIHAVHLNTLGDNQQMSEIERAE